MSQPFVGEIRLFGGNFAPAGWAFCDGQLMAISENETLFNLIGTTYGGDGQSTFALPDLRGRVPIHMGTDTFGNTYQLAQNGGVEQVTLTVQQIPSHSHLPQGATQNTQASPANGVWGSSSPATRYVTPANFAANPTAMAAGALNPTGGSQPHYNMAPYLVISFIISLFGIFPSQT